jgi:hypothetical protein
VSTWDGNNYYYSGQGVVLIGPRDTLGKPAGLTAIGNVSDLKITVATTVIEHKESQTGQRGIDLRLQTETKANLSCTMERFDSANLGRALRGTATKETGATVTAEAITFPGISTISPLQHAKVSAVTVHDGGTALVLGTDYLLNTEAGSIEWLSSTATLAMTAGTTALTVDYTYATQYLIDALTQPLTEYWMRFEGLNTADGNNPVIVDIFKFSVDPLKELALISDTIQQFVLDGTVLADPLQTTGSKYFKVVELR